MTQPVQIRHAMVPCFAGPKRKSSSTDKPLSRTTAQDDTAGIGKTAQQTHVEPRAGEEKDWASVSHPEDAEVEEQELRNKQRENEEFLQKYPGLVSNIRTAENTVKTTSRRLVRTKDDLIATVKNTTRALAVSSLELIAHKVQTAAYHLQQQPRATDRDAEVSSIASRQSDQK